MTITPTKPIRWRKPVALEPPPVPTAEEYGHTCYQPAVTEVVIGLPYVFHVDIIRLTKLCKKAYHYEVWVGSSTDRTPMGQLIGTGWAPANQLVAPRNLRPYTERERDIAIQTERHAVARVIASHAQHVAQRAENRRRDALAARFTAATGSPANLSLFSTRAYDVENPDRTIKHVPARHMAQITMPMAELRTLLNRAEMSNLRRFVPKR